MEICIWLLLVFTWTFCLRYLWLYLFFVNYEFNKFEQFLSFLRIYIQYTLYRLYKKVQNSNYPAICYPTVAFLGRPLHATIQDLKHYYEEIEDLWLPFTNHNHHFGHLHSSNGCSHLTIGIHLMLCFLQNPDSSSHSFSASYFVFGESKLHWLTIS